MAKTHDDLNMNVHIFSIPVQSAEWLFAEDFLFGFKSFFVWNFAQIKFISQLFCLLRRNLNLSMLQKLSNFSQRKKAQILWFTFLTSSFLLCFIVWKWHEYMFCWFSFSEWLCVTRDRGGLGELGQGQIGSGRRRLTSFHVKIDFRLVFRWNMNFSLKQIKVFKFQTRTSQPPLSIKPHSKNRRKNNGTWLKWNRSSFSRSFNYFLIDMSFFGFLFVCKIKSLTSTDCYRFWRKNSYNWDGKAGKSIVLVENLFAHLYGRKNIVELIFH